MLEEGGRADYVRGTAKLIRVVILGQNEENDQGQGGCKLVVDRGGGDLYVGVLGVVDRNYCRGNRFVGI